MVFLKYPALNVLQQRLGMMQDYGKKKTRKNVFERQRVDICGLSFGRSTSFLKVVFQKKITASA